MACEDWQPAIAGVLNQMGASDARASTFESYDEAERVAREFVVPQHPREWRIVQVAGAEA